MSDEQTAAFGNHTVATDQQRVVTIFGNNSKFNTWNPRYLCCVISSPSLTPVTLFICRLPCAAPDRRLLAPVACNCCPDQIKSSARRARSPLNRTSDIAEKVNKKSRSRVEWTFLSISTFDDPRGCVPAATSCYVNNIMHA